MTKKNRNSKTIALTPRTKTCTRNGATNNGNEEAREVNKTQPIFFMKRHVYLTKGSEVSQTW
jgi:hypothetical protein